jgi:hypothetical protein
MEPLRTLEIDGRSVTDEQRAAVAALHRELMPILNRFSDRGDVAWISLDIRWVP